MDEQQWHALQEDRIEQLLDTGREGLPELEALRRLASHGPNRLPEAQPPGPLRILIRQFRNPLVYILAGASLVTLAMGHVIDFAVIGIALLLNAVVGFIQEHRAEASVHALTRLVAPRAWVIRAGTRREIESSAIVLGDLVLLQAGSHVPADVRIIENTALAADESALTGESVPVSKNPAPLLALTGLADRVNMAHAGTTVVGGRGRGYVVATGARTQLGTIAAEVRQTAQPPTPLQVRMNRFSRRVGVGIIPVAALAVGIGLARGQSPADVVMVAVTLVVSAIPEGLPVSSTIALAIGVRRMAHRNAVIRTLPAVETLGSTTVIGSDKTGTLTENRMAVRRLWAAGRSYSFDPDGDDNTTDQAAPRLPAEWRSLDDLSPLGLTLVVGVLANEAHHVASADGPTFHGDPTETALLAAATRCGIDVASLRAAYRPIEEIPFESERRYSASLGDFAGERRVFVKGAPERVLAMCSRLLAEAGAVPLDQAAVHRAAEQLAAGGLRVLAMAYGADAGMPLGESTTNLTLAGLQGMMDPPRPGVRDAIAFCRETGVRVMMITGDHAATGQAIARQLGIADSDERAVTGAQVAELDDDDLRETVARTAVFARIAPEQKLRIVKALQADGQVVAVTGDGINDAPALRAADVGVAMGKGGTDVAREAADAVLLDDNFASITAAIEEGRVTFDNIRKVAFFLIATGVAEVLAITAALALGWPTLLLPVQILWLNLVTNGLQDVALVFEPGEPDVRRRPPRPRTEDILSPLLWERVALTAAVMAAGTLFLFRSELNGGASLARAQTIVLTALVLFEAFQAGNARSERRSVFRTNPFSNPFLFLATASALGIHVVALHLPFTQQAFGIEPIEPAAWFRLVLVASTVLLASEVHKYLRRRFPLRSRHQAAQIASVRRRSTADQEWIAEAG